MCSPGHLTGKWLCWKGRLCSGPTLHPHRSPRGRASGFIWTASPTFPPHTHTHFNVQVHTHSLCNYCQGRLCRENGLEPSCFTQFFQLARCPCSFRFRLFGKQWEPKWWERLQDWTVTAEQPFITRFMLFISSLFCDSHVIITSPVPAVIKLLFIINAGWLTAQSLIRVDRDRGWQLM